jgi:hypothetical protein
MTRKQKIERTKDASEKKRQKEIELEKEIRKIRETPKKKKEPVRFQVGDGATMNLYSDRYAGTIIKVSENGKKVTLQFDKATLDPNFRPDMVAGGFSAHCRNNYEQSYSYERNPDGGKKEFSLRKSGRWIIRGAKDSNREISLSAGRHAFYDYNF